MAISITALSSGQVKVDDGVTVNYYQNGLYSVEPINATQCAIVNLTGSSVYVFIASNVTTPAGSWTPATLAPALNVSPYFFKSAGGGGGGSISPGTVLGQTAYWNGTTWTFNDLLHILPTSNQINAFISTGAGQEELHLQNNLIQLRVSNGGSAPMSTVSLTKSDYTLNVNDGAGKIGVLNLDPNSNNWSELLFNHTGISVSRLRLEDQGIFDYFGQNLLGGANVVTTLVLDPSNVNNGFIAKFADNINGPTSITQLNSGGVINSTQGTNFTSSTIGDGSIINTTQDGSSQTVIETLTPISHRVQLTGQTTGDTFDMLANASSARNLNVRYFDNASNLGQLVISPGNCEFNTTNTTGGYAVMNLGPDAYTVHNVDSAGVLQWTIQNIANNLSTTLQGGTNLQTFVLDDGSGVNLQSTTNAGGNAQLELGAGGNVVFLTSADGTGNQTGFLMQPTLFTFTTGNMVFPVVGAPVTGTYVVTTQDYLIFVDASGASVTITLPTPLNGQSLIIQDNGSASVGNHITCGSLGKSTITTAYDRITLYSDGTNWYGA